MQLEDFVLELLYHHDCVVVPHWGGLVANYRAARLNSVSHVIAPPSKHIGFNRNLSSDDGLLAHHIGLVLGISHADASRLIAQEVARLKVSLKDTGRVAWDKIGVFYQDTQGALQFMPQDQENFLLSSFGLHTIQLKALRIATPTPQTPVIPLHPSTERTWNWKYVSAAALPLVVAGSLWWASQQNPTGGVNWASLNPFRKEMIGANYTPRTGVTTWQNADLGQELPLQIGQSLDTAPIVESKKVEKHTPNSTQFAVIGGAFKVKENANNFLAQLKQEGFDARLVSKSSSIHLVAYGVYATRKEALNAAANVRATDGKNAWIKSMSNGRK